MSEREGRGGVWTEERQARNERGRDEGRNRSEGGMGRWAGARERAGDTVRTDAGPLGREAVPAAFDAGASAYDRLVGANPGYHEHLRLSAQRMRLPGGGRGLRLLDAGCGTGASTASPL